MADNINVKDAAGATIILRMKEVSAGVWLPYHVLMDSSGAEMKGSKNAASSIPVTLPTDQALLGRGLSAVTDPFTRPNDTIAYAVGDLVANSTVAGSVIPFQFAGAARYATGGGRISRVRLFKSGTSIANAQFTVHLFTTSPVPSVGDNAAFNTASVYASNNVAGYIGPIPITINVAFSDGAWGSNVPGGGAGADEFIFKLASGSTIYALLEARAAYTPTANEVFTAALDTEQT